MWKINKKTLLPATLIYCYVPTFIFLIGWVKLIYAIPACAILLVLINIFYSDKINDSAHRTSVNIKWTTLIIVSLFLLITCVCCGYGGFVEQASDWEKHNAILQDLYTHPWPVEYVVGGEQTMLSYYHALYLLPAILGKVFHSSQVVEISFGVLCYIGLWLMSFSLIYLSKADKWYKQLLIVISFLFFSGMLFPLQKVSHLLTGLSFSNNWHAYPIGQHLLQYRSVLVMLRWVGPQCFIVWLCVVLLYQYKDDFSSYSIIIFPAFLGGTWGFLGLVFISILYVFLSSIFRKNHIRNVFSWKNILPALFPGIIIFLYLTNNLVVQGHGIENHETGFTPYHGAELLWLGLFLFFIYGIVSVIVWHRNKNDLLFYTIPISLCCIPFFSIGSEIDFIMGVSIPAIILLFIYSGQFLLCDKYVILKIALFICLVFGAKYPYAELKSSVLSNTWHIGNDYEQQTLETCFDRGGEDVGIIWENYIARKDSTNTFFKYFSK